MDAYQEDGATLSLLDPGKIVGNTKVLHDIDDEANANRVVEA